jgi:N-acetyl-beta-hexosaminidase
LKDIVVKCNNEYSGQFDPTLDLTYDTAVKVMKQVSSLFVDNYTHFGGDEISYKCYDLKPSIKEWMDKNGIPGYP